jgi:hypothetical protein
MVRPTRLELVTFGSGDWRFAMSSRVRLLYSDVGSARASEACADPSNPRLKYAYIRHRICL